MLCGIVTRTTPTNFRVLAEISRAGFALTSPVL